jgi:hypothetical protein
MLARRSTLGRRSLRVCLRCEMVRQPSFPMSLLRAVNSPVRYGMEERLVDIKHALCSGCLRT